MDVWGNEPNRDVWGNTPSDSFGNNPKNDVHGNAPKDAWGNPVDTNRGGLVDAGLDILRGIFGKSDRSPVNLKAQRTPSVSAQPRHACGLRRSFS